MPRRVDQTFKEEFHFAMINYQSIVVMTFKILIHTIYYHNDAHYDHLYPWSPQSYSKHQNAPR